MEILNPFGKRPAPAPRRPAPPVSPLDDADTPIPNTPMTESELAELAAAEDRISRGLTGFADVGLALGVIRDRHLYRDSHQSWGDYLRDRWGMTVDYGSKLIGAMSICVELERAGYVAPVREVHARELGRVAPEHRGKVWADALDAAGGDPQAVTADLIAANTPKRLRKVKGKGKGKVKARPPKPIKLRGPGWSIVIERKREIDLAEIIESAQTQLAAKQGLRAAA